MSCEEFLVGQKPRIPAEFRLGNVLTDPTAVKFIYHRPGDAAPTVLVHGVDAAVVKSAVGKYHVDLSIDIAGTWKWRWESTGAVESALQDSFRAKAEDPIG